MALFLMRRYYYHLFVVPLCLFFFLLILFELHAPSEPANTKLSQGFFSAGSRYTGNRKSDASLSKTAALVKEFQSSTKRPLLVRFNWYTKKKSPVHIGYVQCLPIESFRLLLFISS